MTEAEVFSFVPAATPATPELSLAVQINEAHAEAQAHYAEASAHYENALEHAVHCGGLLILAAENVKAAKPKQSWLGWLKTNCPDIHQTTANDYMRIAEHRDEIKGALSLRDALKQIPAKGSRRKKKEGEEEKTKTGPTPKPPQIGKPVSADLADLLANVGPDEVFDALLTAFERDDLIKLGSAIANHLDATEGA